ncbi:MAG: type VI secretion system baseplate subunit TssG [Bacteroidota bacterium]
MTESIPGQIDFFELVSALQRRFSDRAEVGYVGARGLDVGLEALRFRPALSLVFPPRDVEHVQRERGGPEVPEGRLLVDLNFGGVYGPDSPLPPVFTEMLFPSGAPDGEDREAVRDFLDLFHHRLYSLTYRAWEKRRYATTYRDDGRDEISELLASLAGLGTRGTIDAASGGGVLEREHLLRLSGAANERPRSVSSIRALVQDHLGGGIPARIEPFIPRTVPLETSDLTFLSSELRGAEVPGTGRVPGRRLGVDAVLGTSIVECSRTIRVELGPLTLEDYEDHLPGTTRRQELDTLIEWAAPAHIEHEISLEIGEGEIPPWRLSERADVRLGHTSWVASGSVPGQVVVFASSAPRC